MESEPISIWHARWVKWLHREQYRTPEFEYGEAITRWVKQHGPPSYYERYLETNQTDTPELCLDALVYDFLGRKISMAGSDNEGDKK